MFRPVEPLARLFLTACLAMLVSAAAQEEDTSGIADAIAGTWEEKENGLAYITKTAGECESYIVQAGDEVYITHAGFTEQGRQFDGNVQDELFKGRVHSNLEMQWLPQKADGEGSPVVIGQRRVIQGMEQGMLGQCLKETRLIRMPPHFAYDDPNLRFSSDRKPVPSGSTVLYQITIHEVRRPGTFSYYWVAAVRQGGLPGLIFFLILLSVIYMLHDSRSRKLKRGGGKKRR